MFFHTIPYSFEDPSVVHEASVSASEDGFITTQTCQRTGQTHTRFFDSLREFVVWHYEYMDYIILEKDHPFEDELKLTHPSQGQIDAAIQMIEAHFKHKVEIKCNTRPSNWDTPRATLNTVLWTV